MTRLGDTRNPKGLTIIPPIDSNGRTIWIADAHRDDGKRFVMRADEKSTAFLELEIATSGQRDGFLGKVCFASVPGYTTNVPYTAVGSADKFVFDYVIRHSNASSAGIKKMGFGPTLGPPLYGITQVSSTIQPQQKKEIKNMTTLHLKNSISRSPWRGGFLLIPLVLACFALLPMAQAETDTVRDRDTVSLCRNEHIRRISRLG